jgi:hypothetical protein
MRKKISISFMICFSLDLDQNIGSKLCIYHLATILGLELILKFRTLFISCCRNFCF